MRIDTARNQIGATKALLDKALEEIEDLYVLAYDRQVAGDEVKVNGGDRDYCLDTHGDVRVRAAYKVFSDQVTDTCQVLAEAAHSALRRLSDAFPGGRIGARTSSALEHALLLEAKARRTSRGEYQPVRRLPQQGIDDAVKASAQEIKRLDRQVAKLVKALAKATGEAPGDIKERLCA